MNLRKSILIICEGTSTEPTYFHELRKIVLEEYKRSDIKIKISPIPKEEEKIQEQIEAPQNNTLRPRRQIKPDKRNLEENFREELEYRSQPVCYVRRAQIGLRDFGYDEAWSVYDKDGHPAQEQAFELSKVKIQNKIVNLAFSSIAFELWILLHFEQVNSCYEKSMCRIQTSTGKREYLYCGSNEFEEDCKGEKCLCGKIVASNYLAYNSKRKDFKFQDFRKNVHKAIINASLLSNSYKFSKIPFYDRNPYTSIHKLVFRLLNLETDYAWFEFSERQVISNDSFIELALNNHQIQFSYTNKSDRSVILNPDSLVLLNATGEQQLGITRKQIIPGETHYDTISLNIVETFTPLFICFKLGQSKSLISEIPI